MAVVVVLVPAGAVALDVMPVVLPLVPLMLPDAEVPVVALEPLPGLGVLAGADIDVPLPPAMPASLPVPEPVAPVAFCARTEDAAAALPVSVVAFVCAVARLARARIADPNRTLCSFVMMSSFKFIEESDDAVSVCVIASLVFVDFR
jgi:hypothetical protein